MSTGTTPTVAKMASRPPTSPSGRGQPRLRREGQGGGAFPPAGAFDAPAAASEAQTREEAPSPGAPERSDLSPQAGTGGWCGEAECDRTQSRCPDAQALPPHAGPGEGQGDLSGPALYRLMTWMSPAYPVGAFAYSGGIEWAVEAGDIADAETLCRWLATMISHGSVFCDAAFFAHTHRAACDGDDQVLTAIAELAAAFIGSKERFLETTAQGQAFLQITRTAWPAPALDRLTAAWDGPLAYPVAVAAACAGHGIALIPALHAFVHSVVSNLVSAGVRLIPLGQTDGQRVLAALETPIAATAARALVTAIDEIGAATPRADIAGMRHETQYTRLFRS
jgi:urease accessory protein